MFCEVFLWQGFNLMQCYEALNKEKDLVVTPATQVVSLKYDMSN